MHLGEVQHAKTVPVTTMESVSTARGVISTHVIVRNILQGRCVNNVSLVMNQHIMSVPLVVLNIPSVFPLLVIV